jgi:hypothetical protein
MRKVKAGAAALALCAVVVATGPAAVATAGDGRVEHLVYSDGPFTNVYAPCGAIEIATVAIHDTNFYDAGGAFSRTVEQFDTESVVTGPTGKSISLDAHQTLKFADGIATLTGQGPNVRAPGMGLIYQDVGRLVTDVTAHYPGETLFASAKSVSFAAADPDELAAAICTAVG